MPCFEQMFSTLNGTRSCDYGESVSSNGHVSYLDHRWIDLKVSTGQLRFQGRVDHPFRNSDLCELCETNGTGFPVSDDQRALVPSYDFWIKIRSS